MTNPAPNTLDVYVYDASSGEFAGQYSAQESPLEPGAFIEPTSSTRLAPPVIAVNEVAVFTAGSWVVHPDFRRAALYSTADGSPLAVHEFGPLSEGVTDKPRPSASHEWQAGDWVFNLAHLKAESQASIDSYYQELYDGAVANSALAAEYDAAYMVAKRWMEVQGEPVPERIKALAESYGVTNLMAAGVVVQKWTEAQAVAFDLRGAARLRAKLAIRQAVDAAGVAAAEAAGRAAMEAVEYTV